MSTKTVPTVYEMTYNVSSGTVTYTIPTVYGTNSVPIVKKVENSQKTVLKFWEKKS